MAKTPSKAHGTGLVVANGGTSNLRVHLVNSQESHVVTTVRRSVGVADVARGTEREALWNALSTAVCELEAFSGGSFSKVVALGMLTSEVGLHRLPHVAAPAGPAELAAGSHEFIAQELGGRAVRLIPGVRTSSTNAANDWTDADMMRGEECETLGAWHLLGRPSPPLVFVWPGSHTKIVALDEHGRISGSYTTLAGELLQAIARHTLIKASLPSEFPDQVDLDVLAQVTPLVQQHGLARTSFLVRLSHVLGDEQPSRRAAFWTAAVVADDVLHLAKQPILNAAPQILVGGREPLRSLYAESLRQRLIDRVVHVLTDDQAEFAAAIGATVVLENLQKSGS